MRSYDYCHFEIALDAPEGATLDQINETRKQAALLVDEAIRQYKLAKKSETSRDNKAWQYEQALNRAKVLRQKPDSELSVNDCAFLRGLEDAAFWKALQDE